MSTNLTPEIPAYDTPIARGLLSEIADLRSIDEAITWDFRAEQQISQIEAYLHHVDDFRNKLRVARDAAMSQHSERSFLVRIFSSPRGLAEVDAESVRLDSRVSTLVQLREQLQSCVDKTPNSKEEQRYMLKDLKMVRKELLQQKRELNESMRQIRVQSRYATANVSTSFAGLFLSTPSSRQWSRLSIRLQKESALAPHEDAKSSIERQVLAVDRAIHWIERFQ